MITYIPGSTVSSMPLARFLPPISSGMVSEWLSRNVPLGSWILDPFGASPQLVLEAAQAGYRVLVTCNNPILSLMIEVLAEAAPIHEYLASLSRLADEKRGGERLEDTLKALYRTNCDRCNQAVLVDAFLWRKEENQPYGRIFRCPHCGIEGEHPITSQDLQRLSLPGKIELHKARAVQRLGLEGGKLHSSAEEAINAYLPRQLYFIFTILNKIEGQDIPPNQKKLLYALMTSVCDEGNVLWAHPGGRARPRQLTPPPQFRENNLWTALEEAAKLWCGVGKRTQLVHYPALLNGFNGVCLHKGRLRNILPLPQAFNIGAVVTAFPRPSQAFWSLSAVWSGWFWGPESVSPLRGSLERKRYDWQWYYAAVHSLLNNIIKHIPGNFPTFGILPELTTGYLISTIVAAGQSGFNLEEIALRDDQEIAQCKWFVRQFSHTNKPAPIEQLCREAIRELLLERNEPASYLTLIAACMKKLAQHGVFSKTDQLSSDIARFLQPELERVFEDGNFLKHYSGRGQGMESGQYFLAMNNPADQPTFSDQVESHVIEVIQERIRVSLTELDRIICEKFTGSLTPDAQWIKACLESYCDPIVEEPGYWQVRPQELKEVRKMDLEEMIKMLCSLAQKLGFLAEGTLPVIWKQRDNHVIYEFYPFITCEVSRFVLRQQVSEASISTIQRFIIIPGSRSRLLAQKFEKDPRLARSVAAGWRILKFRHIRAMAVMTDLNRSIWEASLDNDPIGWEEGAATQLQMFYHLQ